MQQGWILGEFGSEPFMTSFIGCISPPLMVIVVNRVGQLFASKCAFGEHDFVCSFIIIAIKHLLMLDKLFTAVICCTIEREIDWVKVTKQAQLTKES